MIKRKLKDTRWALLRRQRSGGSRFEASPRKYKVMRPILKKPIAKKDCSNPSTAKKKDKAKSRKMIKYKASIPPKNGGSRTIFYMPTLQCRK
jgi:hypothetical protein